MRKDPICFVNKGCKNWKKNREKENGHIDNKYHQSAVSAASAFVNNFEHPEDKVASQMDKEIQARARTYRKLLKWWHRLSLIVAANA